MAKRVNKRDAVVGDVKRLRAEVRQLQKDQRLSDKHALQLRGRIEKLEQR